MAETATATRTRQYEGMFILDANLAGKHWDKARLQLTELLENHGVEIIRMEKWEERKLAYEIKKQKRGVYVLCFFRVPPDTIVRLRRDIKMTEWLLRELILTHSGEVTDDLFRKPRARERDREESRRSGKGDGGRREKTAAAKKSGEKDEKEGKTASPAEGPAPAVGEKQEAPPSAPASEPASPEAGGAAETKPAETEPAETKPAETEPAETKPEETEPEETKPEETEPEETKKESGAS